MFKENTFRIRLGLGIDNILQVLEIPRTKGELLIKILIRPKSSHFICNLISYLYFVKIVYI